MHEPDDSVAVTGVGVLSPIGIGAPRFWGALCEGVSGIRAVPGAMQLPRVGAQLVDYLPRDLISTPHLRRMDPVSRMLASATRLALSDAAVDPADASADDLGIIVGSALGDIQESAEYLERLFRKGPSLVSPMQFPNLVLNAAASYAAMELGSRGINLTVTDGEVSGEQAVLLGADCLRQGGATTVIAGGADQWADILVQVYSRARALAAQRGGAEQCSPFDADRSGIVLGEGAGMLVLEPLRRARRRGARPYAIIEQAAAFGLPSSPYGWPRDSRSAAAILASWLLDRAGGTDGIDLVVANGNGARGFDSFLLDTLGHVFGPRAGAVTLTSVRGAIGDFGAAGSLSLAAACLALRHQTVPPLCHLRTAPPKARLALATSRGTARRIERVLHFSAARGGSAVALLLAREPA